MLTPEAGPSSSKLRQVSAKLVRECCQDAWKTKAWRGLAQFFMLGSYLQVTALECFLQEEALPPDPDTRTSTVMSAGFDRFTTPADEYLLAIPRLAEAPETSTTVLCTGQGSIGCKVNYILREALKKTIESLTAVFYHMTQQISRLLKVSGMCRACIRKFPDL